MGSGKRFGVLNCAEDSDYVKKKYGGYFGVFVGMLAEEGEDWRVFRVAFDEFPDENEIGNYDGFVITGSCNDAHGNEPWIRRLLTLLAKLDSMKIKVLGICFGHQILGRAVGGKTGRAKSGWDIGLRTIQLSSSTSSLFNSLQIPNMLSVVEVHQDEVWELPSTAEVLAWSNKTGIEMFRYGDHIMGIQGHPEYTNDILLHLIDRLLLNNKITESYAQELKNGVNGRDEPPNREAWKKLCTGFLKGRL
ncbi:gamma-glutamyl peptidase 5-like [Impatiens glandulifera]|uniref:gamma-glutamyl peptidase 5-like n=1 Tax=Impatiens glandulifera TaxID=253017 RepID=UPI001FB0DD50|nr:gamma-glutamyl peptidase 5-like [Impatiens glandulifera]